MSRTLLAALKVEIRIVKRDDFAGPQAEDPADGGGGDGVTGGPYPRAEEGEGGRRRRLEDRGRQESASRRGTRGGNFSAGQ